MYPQIFLGTEKPSEDINSYLFLMNKKGLRNSYFVCKSAEGDTWEKTAYRIFDPSVKV
jgi:hypothetical protein